MTDLIPYAEMDMNALARVKKTLKDVLIRKAINKEGGRPEDWVCREIDPTADFSCHANVHVWDTTVNGGGSYGTILPASTTVPDNNFIGLYGIQKIAATGTFITTYQAAKIISGANTLDWFYFEQCYQGVGDQPVVGYLMEPIIISENLPIDLQLLVGTTIVAGGASPIIFRGYTCERYGETVSSVPSEVA